MGRKKHTQKMTSTHGCTALRAIYYRLGNGNQEHGFQILDELNQAIEESRHKEFLGIGERKALVHLMMHMTDAMTAMLDYHNVYLMDLELIRLTACAVRVLNREYEGIPR